MGDDSAQWLTAYFCCRERRPKEPAALFSAADWREPASLSDPSHRDSLLYKLSQFSNESIHCLHLTLVEPGVKACAHEGGKRSSLLNLILAYPFLCNCRNWCLQNRSWRTQSLIRRTYTHKKNMTRLPFTTSQLHTKVCSKTVSALIMYSC